MELHCYLTGREVGAVRSREGKESEVRVPRLMRRWAALPSASPTQLPLAGSQPVADGVGFAGERDKILSIFITKHPGGGAGVISSAGTGGRWIGSGGGELAQALSSIGSNTLRAQAVRGEFIGIPRGAAGFLSFQHAGAALGRQLVLQRIARRLSCGHAPARTECHAQGEQQGQDARR